MIELLDTITDEKQKQVVIVKMDIITYKKIIKKEKKDITIDLHNMEKEILNSKWYNSVDELFNDLEN